MMLFVNRSLHWIDKKKKKSKGAEVPKITGTLKVKMRRKSRLLPPITTSSLDHNGNLLKNIILVCCKIG